MITLQQLQYFRTLAANEHLTHTAEQLHISQTTLSGMIIKLENDLGVRLFDRVGRTLQLNETGRGYLAYVNEALTALDNGLAFVEDRRDLAERKITLSITNPTVWTPMLETFHARFPRYSIQLLHLDPNQWVDELLDMKLDFVVACPENFPLASLEHWVFCEQQIYLYVCANHPLANRENLSLQDIYQEPFIALPASQPFRRYCEKLFRDAGFTFNPTYECDYLMSSKLVAAGLGVSLATETPRIWHILRGSHGTNKFIPLAPDVPRHPMALIWNPKRYMGQAARDFLNFLMTTPYPSYLE